MASEERKLADQAIMEENLHKSLGAGERQAETDAFQCGKCKQRKTRYRQAQTRSADEPMTVRSIIITERDNVAHQSLCIDLCDVRFPFASSVDVAINLLITSFILSCVVCNHRWKFS